MANVHTLKNPSFYVINKSEARCLYYFREVAIVQTGKVNWFVEERGFGLIKSSSGESIYLHYSEFEGDGKLSEGDKVQFEVEKGIGNRPKAITVQKLTKK